MDLNFWTSTSGFFTIDLLRRGWTILHPVGHAALALLLDHEHPFLDLLRPLRVLRMRTVLGHPDVVRRSDVERRRDDPFAFLAELHPTLPAAFRHLRQIFRTPNIFLQWDTSSWLPSA